jgi:hypothetical protein
LNGVCLYIAVVGWEKDEEEMNKMVDICPKEYKDRSIKVGNQFDLDPIKN